MKKTICKFLAAVMAVTMALPCVSFADDSADINVIEFENFEGNFSYTSRGNDDQADTYPYTEETRGWWMYKRNPTNDNTSSLEVVEDENGNGSLKAAPSEQLDGTKKSTIYYGKRIVDSEYKPTDGYTDKTGNTKLIVSFDMKFNELPDNLVRVQIRGRKSDDSYVNVINPIYAYKRSDGAYWLTYAGSGAKFKIIMTEALIQNPIKFRFEIDLANCNVRGFINEKEYKLTDTGYFPSPNLTSDIVAITGIYCYNTYGAETQLDNYKVYSVPTSGYQLTATQAENNTDMPISSTFDMTFNGFVNEDTLSDVTVTADGTALAADDYTITAVQSVANGTGAKTLVSITPTEPWEYGTDYVVAIPATATDEAGNAAAVASFTYTTEENPAGELPDEEEPIVIDGVNVIEFENFESDFTSNSRGNEDLQKTNTDCDGWWHRVWAGYTDTVQPAVTADADGNSYIYMGGGTKASGSSNFGVGFGKNLVGAGEEEGSVVLAPYSDKSGATKLVFSFDAEFLELGAAYGFRMMTLATTTQNGTQKTGQNPNYWCARYANNGTYFGNGSTHNNSTWRPAAALNQTYKIAVVADLKNNTLHFYMNGVEDTAATKVFTDRTLDAIEGFWFYAGADTEAKIDNFKAYMIPSGGYELEAVQADDNMDMPLSSAFDMTFNGFVNEDTLSGITVTADGTALSADDYTITSVQSADGTAAQTLVSIAPAESWYFGTDYVVTIPATVTDETGTEATAASFTYTTEAAPSFATEISATTGFAGTGDAITALSDAAGKSINVSFTATNTTGGNVPRATSGMCFVGLYDADGNIIKYGSVNKDYAENQSKSMSFSIAIPADAADLQVKAFVCKDIFDLTPLSDVSIIPWTAE